MANELRTHQNYLGGRRTYTTPATSTVITDGVSNSTTTITSATAAFTAADVGATITGTDLPAGVYIASITNGTTVVLSAAATGTGSARTWTINRHLVFHSAALAAMNVVGTTQHMMVGFDPDGMAGEPEVVMVTKHDSAATWAQIVRAQEGTTARAHTNSGGGADWGHGPFASDIPRAGMLLASKVYEPANLTIDVTSTTGVDLDATNLAVTFVVPPSGSVLVRLTAGAAMNSAANGWWTVREATTELKQGLVADTTGIHGKTRAFVISGLAPGASLTYKWGGKVASGTLTNYIGTGHGPAVMEVWAA